MSKKLISANLKNINEYLFSRQINNSILKVFFDRKNNSNSSDIHYIAFLNCGSSQAKLLHLLKTNNHPVMKWPDLPPEVLKNPNEHSKAIELEKNLLFFPIHQTMRTSVLKSIGISVSNIFNGNLKNDSYELEWYSNGRESWDKYISKADNSSLMQTWSYGESKNQTEGWSVSRGLVKNKGKTIAIFQALEKSWGPIKLIRINRGPIILDEKQDLKSKYQIFQLLSDTWKWWNGDILSIAPNMYNSPDNYGILRLVLNKNRKFDAWQSSLINLSFSSKELRNRLHGKWRNQLKKAESYSLELIIDKSDESFGWLLGLYEKMKKEKSFHGPSVDFYKALHKGDVDNHFIFKLRNHNSIVAGILVVCYGKSCVYQIGWNNSEGRKVYANNFLLWNAILYMKKLGYKWFDLGGIDSKNTPGIAKFKNGIKGENYKLIGEWINVL